MHGDEYRGPAVLDTGDGPRTVEVRLSARFEPVEGRFRRAGRTAALRERVNDRLRNGHLTIAGSPPATARLSEPDPRGGVRLTGTGTPPWFRQRKETA